MPVTPEPVPLAAPPVVPVACRPNSSLRPLESNVEQKLPWSPLVGGLQSNSKYFNYFNVGQSNYMLSEYIRTQIQL